MIIPDAHDFSPSYELSIAWKLFCLCKDALIVLSGVEDALARSRAKEGSSGQTGHLDECIPDYLVYSLDDARLMGKVFDTIIKVGSVTKPDKKVGLFF